MCRKSLKGEYPSTASRQVTEAMRVAPPDALAWAYWAILPARSEGPGRGPSDPNPI